MESPTSPVDLDAALRTAATVTCTACRAEFASRNLLFRHLRDVHSLAPPPASNEERVALIFGYVGDAYHGLQRNDAQDTVPTVEGELWKAIGQLHPSVETARHLKVNPPALSRAARTDRGVHAVANVLGVSLPALGGSSTRWLQQLNAVLPADVRVLRRVRTTAEFHAQRNCERRRYEYLLPYDVLCPGRAGDGPPSADEVVRVRQQLKALLKRFHGTRDYRHFTRGSAQYQAAHDMCRHVFKIFVPQARPTPPSLTAAAARHAHQPPPPHPAPRPRLLTLR